MEKKRILKGLLRLTLALLVTCGVGLSLFGTEVKAATDPTGVLAVSGKGAEVTLTDPDNRAKTIVFYVGGTKMDDVNVASGTSLYPLGAAAYMPKLTDTTEITSKKAKITAKIVDIDGTTFNVQTSGGDNYVETPEIYTIEATTEAITGIDSVTVSSASGAAVKVSDKKGYALQGGQIVVSATAKEEYSVSGWTVPGHTATEYEISGDKKTVNITVGADSKPVPSATAAPKITVVVDGTTSDVGTSVSLKRSVAPTTFVASCSDASHKLTWTAVGTPTGIKGTVDSTNKNKLAIDHTMTGTGTWKVTCDTDTTVSKEITFTCADATIDHISLFVGGTEYKTSTSTITIAPKSDVECTIKAFDDKGNDVTSNFEFSVSSSSSSFTITPSGSTFKINGASGGLTATVAVTASKDSTDKKSNTFTFVTSGFSAVISQSPESVEPGDQVTLTGSITPAPATGETVTFKWEIFQEGKATAVKTGTGATIKYNFPKETVYTVNLTATKGGVSETATTTITPTWEPYIDVTPTTVILSTGEIAYLTGSSAGMFDPDDKNGITLDFTNNKNNIDEANSKVTAVAKNGNTCTIQIKAGSEPTTSSQGLVLNVEYDGIDSNDVKLHVYKKPSVSKTVNTGADQSVTFTIPGYVGTARSANMTVTGYRIKIFKDGNCVKTSDVKSASAGDKVIKISEIINDVASVASGDSYTFKVGIQPVGKVNNAGDAVDAKTLDSSGNEIDFISDLSGEFTVYRLNLTADAGITVSPTATWGVEKQTTEVKATGVVGYWTKNGVKIEGTDGKQSYTHTFSSTTADNRIGAVLGASVPGAAGGAGGATAGLDDVPKTSESNAPIWLIIVLVFAAMGGGYALYMQMKPVKVKNSPKTPFVNGDDDYDDNF